MRLFTVVVVCLCILKGHLLCLHLLCIMLPLLWCACRWTVAAEKLAATDAGVSVCIFTRWVSIC